jgi:copper chaperone
MTTQSYVVQGMTCGHCVGAVTEEVSGIPGVCDVRVDLPSGVVTVESDAPLDDAEVVAEVDEAGYAVVG